MVLALPFCSHNTSRHDWPCLCPEGNHNVTPVGCEVIFQKQVLQRQFATHSPYSCFVCTRPPATLHALLLHFYLIHISTVAGAPPLSRRWRQRLGKGAGRHWPKREKRRGGRAPSLLSRPASMSSTGGRPRMLPSAATDARVPSMRCTTRSMSAAPIWPIWAM